VKVDKDFIPLQRGKDLKIANTEKVDVVGPICEGTVNPVAGACKSSRCLDESCFFSNTKGSFIPIASILFGPPDAPHRFQDPFPNLLIVPCPIPA